MRAGGFEPPHPKARVFKTRVSTIPPCPLRKWGKRDSNPLDALARLIYSQMRPSNFAVSPEKMPPSGIEPDTVGLQPTALPSELRWRKDRNDRPRTCNLWFWKPMLYQLSYVPRVGLGGFEPPRAITPTWPSTKRVYQFHHNPEMRRRERGSNPRTLLGSFAFQASTWHQRRTVSPKKANHSKG